jgi:hypothetical protein
MLGLENCTRPTNPLAEQTIPVSPDIPFIVRDWVAPDGPTITHTVLPLGEAVLINVPDANTTGIIASTGLLIVTPIGPNVTDCEPLARLAAGIEDTETVIAPIN